MFTKRQLTVAVLAATTLIVNAKVSLAASPTTLEMYPLNGTGTNSAAGVILLSKQTGYVTYCTNYSYAGTPPTPYGKCAYIGTVGASPTNGYQVVVNAISPYILNKTTGNLYQCAISSYIDGTAFGKCTVIANASTM